MYKPLMLITLIVFLFGCTAELPLITSSLDCDTLVTDDDIRMGFRDGNFLNNPSTQCQAGYECISGTAVTKLGKSGDLKYLTVPIICDESSLVGWRDVQALQGEGYNHLDTVFTLNCCRVNSVAR